MKLKEQWVQYGADNEYSGYLCFSERLNEKAPAVMVIQEIWGVDDHIRDITRRFAEAGYVAFAPDLYARNGERHENLKEDRVEEVKAFLDSAPPSVWANLDEREKALQQYDDDKQLRISQSFAQILSGMNSPKYIEQLLATSAYLSEKNEQASGKGVATIGFCMGGGLSALMACRDPKLKGAIIFYGIAPSEEELANIQCPVLGFYGELDKRISDTVPELAIQMGNLDKSFEYHIYPKAPHAFFNDTRPSYHPSSARDAYAKTLQFFNRVFSL